jgi:hypothetical protein
MNGTGVHPRPCPTCGTDELDCVSLRLTALNGEPEDCCSDCDHPLLASSDEVRHA